MKRLGLPQRDIRLVSLLATSRKNAIGNRARLVLIASAAALAATLAQAQTPLKPGAIEGHILTAPNLRDTAECEFYVGLGTAGPSQELQIYNTTGTTGPGGGCPAKTFAALDTKKLAAELGANIVVTNPHVLTARKWWIMDELVLYAVGETFDFSGVKATWVATMGESAAVKGLVEASKAPYTQLTNNQVTTYTFKAGRPVFLLRAPENRVYVMQAITNIADKDLTYDQLPQLGSRLKRLPSGWTYEVKTLTQDLLVDFRKATPAGLKHLTVDEYENVYLGCGFDAACNYTP